MAVFDSKSSQPEPVGIDKDGTSYDSYTEASRSGSRKNSSPLPSLSRLSTFSIDMAQIGLSSSSSASSFKIQEIPSKPPILTTSIPHKNTNSSLLSFSLPVQDHFPEVPCYTIPHTKTNYLISDIADRASTLIGSDFDVKGFTSCEEDDIDFMSETVFDSMRSGTTGTAQSAKPPIEFIFDKSPMIEADSSQLMGKNRDERYGDSGCPRLNIDCVSFPSRDDDLFFNKQLYFPEILKNSAVRSDKISPLEPMFSLPKMNDVYNHDNDKDEDWNFDERDLKDEKRSKNRIEFYNTENSTLDPLEGSLKLSKDFHSPERPKSNVFDWSEPLSPEKNLTNGHSPRPKTAHVKQVMDVRSGRVLGRRGPAALHVRSQSVPVVPDTEVSKITTKFGTWGLSSKAVSEDWDGDFEFENSDSVDFTGGELVREQKGVQVPEAIKANQESIVGHVGQIREVCLLVEDLKRLRSLGKSQGLLNGDFESLWQEADGIIALAAPAEEDESEEFQKAHSANISYCSSLCSQNNQHYTRPPSTDSETSFCDKNNTTPDIKSSVDSVSSCHEKQSPRLSNYVSRHIPAKRSTDVARKVMESIHQQRSNSDIFSQKFAEGSSSKMPFDTTSLKDLVSRAATLSRALGQVVRAADGFEQNFESRPRNSSPAFTRVFTDPVTLPTRSSPQKQSNISNKGDSINNFPLPDFAQRMQMMTVT